MDEVKTVEVDSRPSDAIAIALRFGAPIFTNEKIMSEAGIILSDIEESELGEGSEEEFDEENDQIVISAEDVKENVPLEDYPSDELNTMLNEALEAENYELAARIRDILTKRKG